MNAPSRTHLHRHLCMRAKRTCASESAFVDADVHAHVHADACARVTHLACMFVYLCSMQMYENVAADVEGVWPWMQVRVFLNHRGEGGGAGGDLRDPPTTDSWQTHRPTNVPLPRGAIGHPPIHPSTQLPQVKCLDQSPTMAYP